MEEASALHTLLGISYLWSALALRSPEGPYFSHQLQVAQSSVPVGMVPLELGTACAYGRGEDGGGGAGEQSGRCLGDQILSQEPEAWPGKALGPKTRSLEGWRKWMGLAVG